MYSGLTRSEHEEEVLNVGGGKSSVLFRYGCVEQNHHGFESSRVCRDCAGIVRKVTAIRAADPLVGAVFDGTLRIII